MNVEQAYNIWAEQYDTNNNKTRDIEAKALRECLAGLGFDSCLEIGCGTGKNTQWLVQKAQTVTAVDFSGEMLARAREKVTAPNVVFKQADITHEWDFATGKYGLITFSLVLEHIQNLDYIFKQCAAVLQPGGYVYIGELHPFKQYTGSKARFDTEEGRLVVQCFTHNISEFTQAAKKHGLQLIDVNEYFDDDDSNNIPRLLNILLQKAR